MINSDILNSSTGIMNAKVEFYNGSTLVKACTCSDYLQDFNVSRVGDNSKFFGFGVCQKLSVKLIDMWKDLVIASGNTVEISYVVGNKELRPYPTFTITEVNVDEDTNDISVTAYDKLYDAESHEISEVNISTHTVRGYVEGITTFLGVQYTITGVGETETCFDTDVGAKGANLDGTEKLRSILDDIAEVTQTVYYLNFENVLVFKRLDMAGDPVLTISRDIYSVLKTSENRRLSAICSATELGDNIEKSLEISGTTQYIRENCFWNAVSLVYGDEELANLIDNAVAVVGGFTIGQIRDCSWTGNILLEIGDKLAFEKDDGTVIISYLLDDDITYDGFIEEKTIWEFNENDTETDSNPTSLDEALNKTFARVDKVNRTITLYASEVSDLKNDIANLSVTPEKIEGIVSGIDQNYKDIQQTNSDLKELSTIVTQTKKDLTVTIESISKGAEEVKTITGYTFDEFGLTIDKDTSEMSTQITEDGMTVSRQGQVTLTANNDGVQAENLHATTWLVIGGNSRFEDYIDDNGKKRTACFWIGV